MLVWMVVFHLVVNLSSFDFDQRLFYWVPLGFMLFLGVILGQFLTERRGKILILSAKLLGIFFLLNILNFASEDFTAWQLLIGDQKMFSFEILLPMGVLALMSAGLSKAGKWPKMEILSGGVLLGVISYLSWIDVYSYNFFFLVYGLVGYLLGKNFNLDGVAKRVKKPLLALLSVVVAIAFLITGKMGIMDILVIGQVLALYVIVAKVLGKNGILNWIGKNSLWIYVGHIVLIKVFS